MRILGILIYTMVTRSTPHKPSTSSDIQQIIWLYETCQKTLENFISYLYILDPGHKVTSIHETPDCFSVMEPHDEAQEKWSVQPQTPWCVSCYCLGYKGQEIAETIEKKRKKKERQKRKDIVATYGMFYHQFSDGYILQQTWKLVKTNSNKSPAEDPSNLTFPVRMTGS